MNPAFGRWIVVFNWMKNPVLEGMVPKMLDDIGWTDLETLSLLARMNVRFETEAANKRESERKTQAGQYSGSSRSGRRK